MIVRLCHIITDEGMRPCAIVAFSWRDLQADDVDLIVAHLPGDTDIREGEPVYQDEDAAFAELRSICERDYKPITFFRHG